MAIAAADGDGLGGLVQLKPGRLERRVRQFAVKRVGVGRPRRAEPGQPAMNHEGAIGLEIDHGVDRLVEHGFHRQLAAVETGAPDLLSLEGKNDDLAARIADPQRRDAGRIGEGGDAESPHLAQRALGFAKA